jgi:hypothetical protein
MHYLFCWINHNAAGLTAIFTFLYLIATILIFNEARKSADAAKKSADAAGTAADAAKTNAQAAIESITVLRRELDEQALRRRLNVQTGVASSLKATSFWRKRIGDLTNLVVSKIYLPLTTSSNPTASSSPLH